MLTDTEGGRANYETAEPGQFVITVSDDYYNESVFMQVFLYSMKTKYMAKKLAEFNGNRSEKRKEKYTILRKTTIQKIIKIKWKIECKDDEGNESEDYVVGKNQNYSEILSASD